MPTGDLTNCLLNGQYRIERCLGKGGFAEVYLATDTKFGARKVALKVLRREFSDNEEDVRRFFDEARICGNIHDPNGHIVHVYEFGTWMDLRFIVMEMLDGRTLRAELDLRSRPFAHAEALDIAEQICEGLAVAHHSGVAHRDLKPDNVFLCPTPYGNNVKLLDLGIAKVVDSRVVGAPQHRSRVGVILGTPAYLAPEMFFGNKIDYYLADVYALGVMLYEMLTGETPFHGEGVAYYAYAHAYTEPMRPSEVNPGIKLPTPVERLVLRCLAKSPNDRYKSVEELANQIRSLLAGESRASRRPLFMAHADTTPKEVPPPQPRRFPSVPEPVLPQPSPAASAPTPEVPPGGTIVGLGLAGVTPPQRSPAAEVRPQENAQAILRPPPPGGAERAPAHDSSLPASAPRTEPPRVRVSDDSRTLFVGLLFIAALILMFTSGTLLIKIIDTSWMPRSASNSGVTRASPRE